MHEQEGKAMDIDQEGNIKQSIPNNHCEGLLKRTVQIQAGVTTACSDAEPRLGSGSIIRENGLILTNAHVVGNHSTLAVKLYDGRDFKGRLIKIDRSRDIAAIKIEPDNLLLPFQFSLTQNLTPGDTICCTGSPLGFPFTVSMGIVSSKSRTGKEIGLFDEGQRELEFIQFDATVNVGSSGGPLLDSNGKLIGIVVRVAQHSERIGFAIPICDALKFLINIDDFLKPFEDCLDVFLKQIGIRILPKEMYFPVRKGISVHEVYPNSPAYLAGMQNGDVITHINKDNNIRIRTRQHLINALENCSVLNITVKRKFKPAVMLQVVPERFVH